MKTIKALRLCIGFVLIASPLQASQEVVLETVTPIELAFLKIQIKQFCSYLAKRDQTVNGRNATFKALNLLVNKAFYHHEEEAIIVAEEGAFLVLRERDDSTLRDQLTSISKIFLYELLAKNTNGIFNEMDARFIAKLMVSEFFCPIILQFFKIHNKWQDLVKLLNPHALSAERRIEFILHAATLHYATLFDFLIELEPWHHSTAYNPVSMHGCKPILEKTLKELWFSKAAEIYHVISHKSLNHANELQNILNAFLVSFAEKSIKKRLESDSSPRINFEAIIYFLLCFGARLTMQQFVAIFSKLEKGVEPVQGHAAYNLLRLFNHSGLSQYCKDRHEFMINFFKIEELHIPHVDWGPAYANYLWQSPLRATRSFYRSFFSPVCTLYATPINRRNDAGQSVLMWAAILNRLDDLQDMLFNKMAHVNARDYYRRTPLMYAARFGSPEAVRMLLAKGARISVKDVNTRSALAHALETRNYTNALLIIFALKKQDAERRLQQGSKDTQEQKDECTTSKNFNGALNDIFLTYRFNESSFYNTEIGIRDR